jgi:hypothetical protein
MRIDSSNYSMQRNGGLLNNKRSPEVIRENLKKVHLTEEDWQEIYRQVNAPKPEVVPEQKSVGSVLKEAWLKVFPKKEEKAGNDIIATSWDEMGH